MSENKTIKGINFPIDYSEKKAWILATCNNCKAAWSEEIVYRVAFANSTSYDACSECIAEIEAE